jgi:hypothetical protein
MRADELLRRFAVYGRFYGKSIAGVNELLRDRLEIAPIGTPVSVICAQEPDLLVVMMNPGASRPLDSLWDAGQLTGFTSAQPDRTQYQIMKLMLSAQAMGLPWQHARILNLSDLRTPKSAVFLEKLNTYQADASHSIFSASREQECTVLFSCKKTPVLCAWGLNPQLEPWAKLALGQAAEHPLLGLTDDGLRFRHPLPQRHDLQLQWLAGLERQLRTV